jgi:rare lipoprotein A
MVTNLTNGKSVIVRINDRGPFIEGRIIDLSYAAAQMLDMVDAGVVPVKIEVLWDFSPPILEQRFAVQVGSFIHRDNAEALKKTLGQDYRDVAISVFKTPSQTYYRVRIRARSLESAQETARRLIRDGYKVFIIEGKG